MAHAPDAAETLVETPNGLLTTAKTTQLRTPIAAPTTYGLHDRLSTEAAGRVSRTALAGAELCGIAVMIRYSLCSVHCTRTLHCSGERPGSSIGDGPDLVRGNKP